MKTQKLKSIFTEGQSFTNVYFLKVDAAGHSNIVINNPHDKVDTLFDLIEESIYSAVEDNKKKTKCQYAEFWGWQGDGGLCVIYDEEESKAIKTSLGSAFSVLDFKLEELQSHVKDLGIKGELHIRMAIHKGSYTYKGDSKKGSIHSKDLNFVAHLEPQTPKDCLAISEDVYRCLDHTTTVKFIALNYSFEDKKVYVYKKVYSNKIHFEWLNKIRFHDSFKINTFPERLSEEEKATFIKMAQQEVIDLGTASRTCSLYLGTTQRPAHYRDVVFELLDKGVDYTCLILNPESEIIDIYGKLRCENLKDKARESLKRFSNFADKSIDKKGTFKVLLYSQLPYFACITVDRKSDYASFIFSPYMPNHDSLLINRADTMHFLFSKYQNNNVYMQLNNSIDFLINDNSTIEYKFE